jgi:hypothetical protein
LTPEEIDCAEFPDAFDPSIPKRETPRKLAHAIQLGHDLDMLEILLYEIYDLVDHIFIVGKLNACLIFRIATFALPVHAKAIVLRGN